MVMVDVKNDIHPTLGSSEDVRPITSVASEELARLQQRQIERSSSEQVAGLTVASEGHTRRSLLKKRSWPPSPIYLVRASGPERRERKAG